MSGRNAAKPGVPAETRPLQLRPRRPASWLDDAEIRRRARGRNLFYIAMAVACMGLFVVLIGLLMERTRWSAGSSEDEAATLEARRPAPAAR